MKHVPKIKVTTQVLQGLEAVRSAGSTNMFDYKVAIAQAVALGHLETAQWIESNLETYLRGIFQGFEAIS